MNTNDRNVSTAEAPKGGSLETNVRTLLDRCPYTVRSREGGGEEDLTASLCITFIGMQNNLAAMATPAKTVQQPMSDEEAIAQLREDFQRKHRECEKAAHALAAATPVGRERNRAFDLYEIIRTAPREAQS